MTHPVKPVAYLSGNGNYTTLHYADGSRELSSYTIRRLTRERYPGFVRISKSLTVNPRNIVRWAANPKGKVSTVVVRMRPTWVTLVIARRRAKDVDFVLTNKNR